jgi:acetate---CoA ligase (ADP-forming)
MSQVPAPRYEAAAVDALLNPRSVAIVGASPDTLWSRYLLDGIRQKGYRGNVACVNPSRRSVLGFPAYPSVAALPETPDLAAVLLGARHVPKTLDDLAARGCRAAYVLASGFETPDRLAALREHVERLGMILIGPNCNGFINAGSGLHLWTGPINRPYQLGGIALLGQSSGVLGALCASVWERGLGISFQISTGNQVNFALTHALEFLSTQPDTRAVVTYVEQFGDYAHFAEGVRRCRQNDIPVIVLAVGRSEAGSKAALGHTGAITTSGAVSRAAIEACGAIPAQTLDEALDRACVFAQVPRRAWRPVRSVGLVSISGGWAALMGDVLSDEGLATPPLPASVTAKLPPGVENVTFNNPFDITAQVMAWAEAFYPIVDEMVKAPEYDAVTVMFGNWEGGNRFYAPVQGWAYKADKPVLGSGIDETGLAPSYRMTLAEDPMPYVNGGSRLARGLAAMRQYYDNPGHLPDGWGSGAGKRWSGAPVLTVPDAAPVLAEYGVKLVPHTVLAGPGASGKPPAGKLAVKLESPELPHKTEAGAVLLGIEGADALQAAVAKLEGVAKARGLERWQVIAQPMADATHALELLVGVVVDRVAGPVLTLSAGGIFAELMERAAHAVCPVPPEKARKLIAELGLARVFAGYRGRPALDQTALEALLVAVSNFAYDYRDSLIEMDLNPVLVLPTGLAPVDALVRFKG